MILRAAVMTREMTREMTLVVTREMTRAVTRGVTREATPVLESYLLNLIRLLSYLESSGSCLASWHLSFNALK
jgi:hypothetical protein